MDKWLRLSEIAAMANGELRGEDIYVSDLSTDTRKLNQGDLFVALQGQKFDGHAFIDKSLSQQVQAVMVHKDVQTELPVIRVDDTLRALSRWANEWRKSVNPKVIGITGSNGKTTVKQMITSIFSQAGSVCATKGNLNNHIGVPLTLLSMRKNNDYAVIEMGANHKGEINHLTHLAEPDVAVITNAGPAHLEGFGSIEGVAHAKGEIINGILSDGTIVLNADDQYLSVWLDKAEDLNVLTFGFSASADVKGRVVSENELAVTTAIEEFQVTLPMMGKHNMYNALASIAVASALHVDTQKMIQGLQETDAATGRLNIKKGVLGSTIIDDAYNANPASLQAAIKVLCSLPGESWLVLGDMGELGQNSREIHAQMGEFARIAGVKKLFVLGELSAHAADEFGAGAMKFMDREQLGKEILSQLHADCCVLVKGSRSMHMEDIVKVFVEPEMMH
jgi:UDP-N-acetylmuramoyl-tripeptide--D-alanyl-D-alanine ligase